MEEIEIEDKEKGESISSKESDGKLEKPGQSEPSEEEIGQGQEREKEKKEPKKMGGKKKNGNGVPRAVKSPRKKVSKK